MYAQDQDAMEASGTPPARKRKYQGLDLRRQKLRSLRNLSPPSDPPLSGTSNGPLQTEPAPSQNIAQEVVNGLCGHCRVLELNDGEHGGIAPSSTQRLRFRKSTLELSYRRSDRLRDMPSLSATEEAGCQFCRLLVRALRSYYSQAWHELDGTETIDIRLVRYSWDAGLQNVRVNFVYKRAGTARNEEFVFPIAAHPGVSTEWLGIARRPRHERLLSEGGTELQPDVAERIRGWISECENHVSAPVGMADIPPTRLLYVPKTDAQGEIRLIGTSDYAGAMKGVPWKYAALSHCWGDPAMPPLKTTRENINAMSTSIPFEALPRTYQDAATVCRSLEIPYLWIDSLCIVQDDKQDWELESPRMAEIYEQAYITIIPTVAGSCHEGFLSRPPLPPSYFANIPYQSALNPLIQGSYTIGEADFNTKDSHLSMHFLRDTKEAKWGSRGWTFTEQLFSTRRLYFGTTGMHWSCDDAHFSERLNPADGDGWRQSPEEFSLRRYINLNARLSAQNALWIWYRQVLEYSSRRLTVPHDRLPAVSALAKRIAGMTGGDRCYLAGLWRSDLHRGLLWTSEEARARPVLPGAPDYLAPSWSWLAQARRADMRDDYPQSSGAEARPCVRVKEAETTCDGLNPFGRVLDGHLTLEGKAYCLLAEGLRRQRQRESFKLATCNLDGTGLLPDVKGGNRRVSACDLRAEHALLLFAIQIKGVEVSGLVLVPSGRRDGEYCRAGIFQSSPHRDGGVKFLDRCETWTVTII